MSSNSEHTKCSLLNGGELEADPALEDFWVLDGFLEGCFGFLVGYWLGFVDLIERYSSLEKKLIWGFLIEKVL